MIWKKIGRIFCADHNSEFMETGGRAPVALHIRDDLFRVYFGSYDAKMRGKIYSLDFDLRDPKKVKNKSAARKKKKQQTSEQEEHLIKKHISFADLKNACCVRVLL